MDQVLTGLNQSLDVLRTNTYASTATSLFLVMYAGLAAPALPPSIAALFEYSAFKFLILVMVVIFLQNKNPTLAILVATGFVISMGTLSRYRVFTMANELSGLGSGSGSSDDSENEKKDAAAAESVVKARGPNGQPKGSPSNVATWKSKDGTNHVTIRGYDYVSDDNKNHLPGGHGAMEPGLVQSQQVGPVGYTGGRHATIGTPNSQL